MRTSTILFILIVTLSPLFNIILFTINDGHIPASREAMLGLLFFSYSFKAKPSKRMLKPWPTYRSVTLAASSKMVFPSSTWCIIKNATCEMCQLIKQWRMQTFWQKGRPYGYHIATVYLTICLQS